MALRSTSCVTVLLALVVSCAPGRAERRADHTREEPHAAAGPDPRASATPSSSADPRSAAAAEPPWLIDQQGDRIGSVGYRTWIWGEPHQARNRLAIGSLRVGTSVKLRSKEPVKGHGCASRWFAIEPHGYVCADDSTTTNFSSPYWKALATLRPGPGAYPYRYAFSMGAPMYSRVPTPDEQKSAESSLGPTRVFHTLGKWSEGHEKLVTTSETEGFAADGAAPDFYQGHAGIGGSPWHPAKPKVKVIPKGSGFAYARAFEAAGRLWLLTPDLFLVPADRVWPYRRSAFKGVELDAERTLPVAWVRAPEGVPRLRREGDVFKPTADPWPGRKPVFLTGVQQATRNGPTYFEAKDGSWLADDANVSLVLPKTELKLKIGEDEKWLEASIQGGTMTAFVGKRPVFTTLWSPGAGGVPVKGLDHKKYMTTELGIFPIQWKDWVETMSPDKGAPTVFWFADVPWIQYVHPPMAMHVSYWHESFGYPMSAECLNVSANDGKWLFDFTLPALPEGWGSVGAGKVNGPSTKINIVQ